jgi:hypothetical protein
MSPDRLPMKPGVDAPVAPTKTGDRIKGKSAPRVPRPEGKTRLKPKALTAAKRAAPRRREPLPDQSGLKPPRGADGYIRLHVRVDDGEMSIVDTKVVDSTLVQPAVIHGNFAYEVTEGDRRLHFDSIPDIGVTRSFVNPGGPLEERQHNITENKAYEFMVRIPVASLRTAAMPQVAVALYRVKEPRPHMVVTERPIAVEYERELREVARLEGLPAKVLLTALPRPRPARRAKAKRRSKK